MRVIVTRPEREAQQWVNELTAGGLQAVALPLIKIGPVDDSCALEKAWRQLPDYVGVMFVSGNAVRYFFAARPQDALTCPDFAQGITKAWGPGPGTAKALLAEGVAAQAIDTPAPDAGQFDSEALWQLVASQVEAGHRVLIVRGDDAQGSAAQGVGRDWFAKRVAEAGGTVDFVVSYQRIAPKFDDAQAALASGAANDGTAWLFSSSEAVNNLLASLPEQDWSSARALATHPRIAAAAKAAGFGWVYESRPTLPDVLTALRSMDGAAA